jgi:type IV pilus assembly protein PilX
MTKITATIHQQGAALITSLIILLVLTMLGVSAMNSSSLQELMAGNMRDQNLSFQAAEAALRDAERVIGGFVVEKTASSTGTLYNGTYIYTPFDETDPNFDFGTTAYNTSMWNPRLSGGLATTYSLSSLGTKSAPVYVVEDLQFVPKDKSWESQIKHLGKTVYRITARGTGA